ncbi:unnamed protein product, partial [Amoebophrya sp. A25]
MIESVDHFATSFGNSSYLNRLTRQRFDPVSQKTISSALQDAKFSTLGVSVYAKSVWLEMLEPGCERSETAGTQQQGSKTAAGSNSSLPPLHLGPTTRATTTAPSDSKDQEHLRGVWLCVGAFEARYVAIGTGAFRIGCIGRDFRAFGERAGMKDKRVQSVEHLVE